MLRSQARSFFQGEGKVRHEKGNQQMRRPVPILTVFMFLVGGIVALFGTYWDDAWHSDRGRDSFTIPPHLLLYGGVLVIGAATVWWAALRLQQEKRMRAVIGYPPLLLALIGDAVTLASAPIDNAWHTAFGRDAVLWSPPHLLGIVGLLTVGSGMLLAVSQYPGRRGYLVTSAVGALVLCVSLIPVMEYESDVPQFASAWYLPVLTVGSVIALTLIHIVSQRHWIGTASALVFTGLRAGIVLFLLLMGFSLPLLPLVIVPALVFDATARWRWPRIIRAVLYALAVYASYVPYLNFLLSGVSLSGVDVIIGLPLATVLSWLILVLVEKPRFTLRPIPAVLSLLIGFFLLLPGHALAHDPGQGNTIGTMQLIATLQNTSTILTATVLDTGLCNQLEARRLEARRAGNVITAPLHRSGACQFTGVIQLSQRGNWFLYAELVQRNQHVETWLPVHSGETSARFTKLAPLYEIEATSGSALEITSSIVLYVLIFVLLVMILFVYRHQQRRISISTT